MVRNFRKLDQSPLPKKGITHDSAGLIGQAAGMVRLLMFLMLSLASLNFPAQIYADTHPGSSTNQVNAPEGIIVALGDSLTEGLGVDEDQAYPAQLLRKLKAHGYDYAVINAGVSGETSSGTLSRLKWVISSLKPDIVILETGANDGLRGIDPALLESNLDQLIRILKGNQVEVVLAGMRMLPNLGPDYIKAFSTIYPKLAQTHDVIFMPFFLEGVAGQSQFNQADKIHPTAEGYRRIVEHIYPYVLRAIAAVRARN